MDSPQYMEKTLKIWKKNDTVLNLIINGQSSIHGGAVLIEAENREF